ncbi:MAG TPA: DNA repair exonuclease [Candidatus Nitrosocosmicus sp.]|nr:DNA repair exonuclease [Candidatus Nitrosocosmicus sp.]
MLISHISDIHLGYAQFNLQEREEDLYEVFGEAIEKSISEHVKAVILAGDIFHNPKPNGAAIIKLARELKKLKEKSIPVFFVLGEHDISRSNDVPLPYLFHNLGLARRLKPNSPIQIENLLIYGFNKERRSNIDNGLIRPFRKLESIMKNDAQKHAVQNHWLKKILVLHQGLYDFNKFAGEIFSNDLPVGFDYYAMGHYHDHIERRFPTLNEGLVAYPGSIDLGHNEVISDVEKGFLLVDLSEVSENVNTHWIKLEKRRHQFEYPIEYSDLDDKLGSIIQESIQYSKKPVIDLKISGEDIDPKILSRQLLRLETLFLYYNWSILDKDSTTGFSYDKSGDFDMDKEMSSLILKSLNSEPLTHLSLDLINMFHNQDDFHDNKIIDKGKSNQIANYVWKFFENNKSIYQTLDNSKINEKGD